MTVQVSQANNDTKLPMGLENSDGPGHMRLTGWRRNLAQFTWVMFALINFAAYLSGIPATYAIASTLKTTTIARLAEMGLPPNAPAMYLLVLNTITLFVFGTVAVLIFKRRSDDPMALLASTMLIFTVMLYTAPGYEASVAMPIVAAGIALGEEQQSLRQMLQDVAHVVVLLGGIKEPLRNSLVGMSTSGPIDPEIVLPLPSLTESKQMDTTAAPAPE